MNNYVTAGAIKALREKKGLTQNQLAQILNVSDKAVPFGEAVGRGSDLYRSVYLINRLVCTILL